MDPNVVESVACALSFGKIVGYNIMDGKNSREVVAPEIFTIWRGYEEILHPISYSGKRSRRFFT